MFVRKRSNQTLRSVPLREADPGSRAGWQGAEWSGDPESPEALWRAVEDSLAHWDGSYVPVYDPPGVFAAARPETGQREGQLRCTVCGNDLEVAAGSDDLVCLQHGRLHAQLRRHVWPVSLTVTMVAGAGRRGRLSVRFPDGRPGCVPAACGAGPMDGFGRNPAGPP